MLPTYSNPNFDWLARFFKGNDMTLEDAKKEGYDSLKEFRKVWEKINGYWDPNQVVWVYEFKMVKS